MDVLFIELWNAWLRHVGREVQTKDHGVVCTGMYVPGPTLL
jgi:hypothetical protein